MPLFRAATPAVRSRARRHVSRCRGAVRRVASPRRAVVLLIVLVVVVVLALSAYTFSDIMLTHRRAAEMSGRQAQTRALVDSGVESVRLFLMQDEAARLENGGLFENETAFRGVLALDDPDPAQRGRFAVVAPGLDDSGYLRGHRFGLENESARLNVNALLLAEQTQEGGGRDLLMALPGMTEDVADAILDWLDEDDDARELGAEVETYAGLDPPYRPTNGPIATVEELLLVRGVTPELLFGRDANRNGLVDPAENETVLPDVDNANGVLDRGWSAYLTLHGQEKNLTRDGNPRVFLNQTDMQQLYNELLPTLGPEAATFIVAYRQNGPYTGSQKAEKAGGQLDLTKPGGAPIARALDLIGAKTRARFQGAEENTVLASPYEDGPALGVTLPILMDAVSVNPSPTIPGRLNINQAPRQLLLGVPGLSEEKVDQILTFRSKEPDPEDLGRQHETWILTSGIVTLDEMKLMQPFISARGDAHRAQIVGYFADGGQSTRAEVVFDATQNPPRVVFWRDLSHLGRGFAVETLGVELQEE